MKINIETGKAGCSARALPSIGLTVLLCLPSTGHCYEVTVGLDAAYVYDSNYYRTDNNEDSADSIEPGGTIDVNHEGDRFRFHGIYIGSYKFYHSQSDANDGPENRLRLRGSYDINRLTRVEFRDSFRDVRNIRYNQYDILDGDTAQESRNQRYQRNDLELTLHRDISRTWEADITSTYQFINYNNNIYRSDSDSIGVGARLLHRFSPRHRFGAGVSRVEQNFDGDAFRLDAKAKFTVANLVWVYDIGDQVQLIVNGGPAWIDTSEDSSNFVKQTEFVGGSVNGQLYRANVFSCGFDTAKGTGIASDCNSVTPGAEPIPATSLGDMQSFLLPDGGSPQDENDTTFFGGVALQGTFSDWTVDTEIRRQQSPPAGDALAAELTSFRWGIDYAPPLSRWSAYFAGSVERLEAFNSSTTIDYVVVPGAEDAAQRSLAFTRVGNSSDRRDTFTALLGVKRQFTRHFSGDLSVSYRGTDYRTNGSNNTADTYFLALTFSYVFDPFRF